MAEVGKPKGVLESKKAYAKRRQGEIDSYVAKANTPPSNDIDTKGRPVDPKRTKWGYRGHDPSREPMKEAVRVARINRGEPGVAPLPAAAKKALAGKPKKIVKR